MESNNRLEKILINIENDIYRGKSFSEFFNVIGFGETTSVLEIKDSEFQNIVLKRVPFFKNKKECEEYISLHSFYVSKIAGLGLKVAQTNLYAIQLNNNWSVYVVQERFKEENLLANIIKKATLEEAWEYIKKILDLSQNVFREDIKGDKNHKIGLDMQVENWVVENGDLIYFDTATPLLRKDGKEQLNLSLFFRGVWRPIGFIAEKFFVNSLLSDYYDFRKSTLDMIANLYKEGRGDIIKDIIQRTNEYMKNLNWPIFSPFSFSEVKIYYKQNVAVWETYLKGKKIKRFFDKLRGVPYPCLLPDKIKR